MLAGPSCAGNRLRPTEGWSETVWGQPAELRRGLSPLLFMSSAAVLRQHHIHLPSGRSQQRVRGRDVASITGWLPGRARMRNGDLQELWGTPSVTLHYGTGTLCEVLRSVRTTSWSLLCIIDAGQTTHRPYASPLRLGTLSLHLEVRAGQVFIWASQAWRISWKILSPQQELFSLLLEGFGCDPFLAHQAASREDKGHGFRTPLVNRRGAVPKGFGFWETVEHLNV